MRGSLLQRALIGRANLVDLRINKDQNFILWSSSGKESLTRVHILQNLYIYLLNIVKDISSLRILPCPEKRVSSQGPMYKGNKPQLRFALYRLRPITAPR